ncbi:PhoH family protein [Varunaivibrio sulfuroxidans]|uniref:PhoH family protein n=1 Tax=Varunaivibrio sulfuroxidans TaxID=1773489 RepID=UPI00389A3D06
MSRSVKTSTTPRSPASAQAVYRRTFEDNTLAVQLFGAHNAHLARVEEALGVHVENRGNTLSVRGSEDAIARAAKVFEGLYRRLERGKSIDSDDVDAAVRLSVPGGGVGDLNIEVRTKKRHITPRSPTQADYLRAIDANELVFGLGPAGTGKTYLAVAKAVERLVGGEVDRIILSRPAVEAGEQLGFLPGDMREKVDPYLRPLYDALYDMLPAEQVVKRLENGEIEVAPLAFMRGRTLANAFVILDEAQNTSAVQMKMFLTRLGENARMVITGDLSQVDLPRGVRSGLRDACDTLDGVAGVGFAHFTAADVVRHPLVTRIVNAYDAAEEKRHAGARYAHEEPEKERPRGRRNGADG